jgi:DNA-binding winged helix-turn-helix (wHTH) protein/Tol biopolymer transport system component
VTEPSTIRFGIFELDLEAGELRRNGSKVRLQEQPYQILVRLLERPGKVVTRDELRKKLWPADTFVDFDHGLNAAIRRLREALDDSADTPRFVETVARHGYRFIAPVDVPRAPAPPATASVATDTTLASQPSQASSSAVIAFTKQHRWAITAGAFVVLVVLSAAGFGVYSLVHRPAPMPFQRFTVTQVTHTGKAAGAAISSDGRYILSVMDDNGLESLWLRNVPTGSDTQVVPPSAAQYESLAFSPDGNYIYFRKAQGSTHPPSFELYRSPILGGTPQTVVEDIDSDITFSPDGQRIAYVRLKRPGIAKYGILTASLEGNDEKVLLASESPDSLAWSPRSDEIAYLLPNFLGDSVIDLLDLGTGKSHRFVTVKDKVPVEIRWSPDGQTLFARYFLGPANFPWQIGSLRRTGGNIEPITRDTNRYTTLTLSSNGRTIATVLTRSYATISVFTKAGREFGEPRPLLSQSGEYNEFGSLTWAADGNLLVTGAARLFKLSADGKSPTQLLGDSGGFIVEPSSCGTSYFVLTWVYHGGTKTENVWRVAADGSNPLKLTDGAADESPVCSADRKWVYYIAHGSGHVNRVPLDGSGRAEASFSMPQGYEFVGDIGDWLDVSPDGKRLAIAVAESKGGALKIALFDIGSSIPPRMLNASSFSGQGLQFTPDGKSLAYAIRENGVDNVWVQPLDGSPGYPITNFKSEQIWSFSLSADGKSLAILRGHYDSDVVLLQETKQ